jgi:hypothetical protein
MLRPSCLLWAVAALALAFMATFVDAARLRYHGALALAERQALVARWRLTDLCLFTEARYTRHPSQADLFTAFQDHPLALEHFPSGSLLPPPDALIRHHENPDREAALPD